MAYTLSFRSLDETLYMATIGGTSGSGTLTGTAEPFDTQEDSEADIFKPVRQQSGYLRFFTGDDTSLWRSLIPSGVLQRPVVLRSGSTIVWQGYVQTGTFGMPWPAFREECELPLICPLSALEGINVPTSWPDTITVGRLIYNILSQLSGITISTVYFHAGSNAYATATALSYQLQTRNFYDDDDGTLTPKYNMKELLEEVCRFFGWSCRMQGTAVYFTCQGFSSRRTQAVYYTLSGLLSPTSYATTSLQSVTLTQAMYGGSDHQEEIVPGVRQVTVKSDINSYDVILKVPQDRLFRKYNLNAPRLATRWRGSIADSGAYQIWLINRVPNTSNASFSYEDDLMTITTYAKTVDETQSTPQCYGRLIIFDEDGTEGDEKKNYRWTTCFECFLSNDYEGGQPGTPYFTLESKDSYMLAGGILYIKGRCDYMEDKTFSADCILRVGNYYWNGASWSTQVRRFTIEYDAGGIKSTRTSPSDPNYDGHGVPVGTMMMGTIRFEVVALHYCRDALGVTTNGYMPLMDFEIGFVRNNVDSELNDKTYTASGGQFPDKTEIDTIFSSNKRKYYASAWHNCDMGFGLVLDEYGYILESVSYGGYNEIPEQHLANAIASYGSTTHRVLTLTMRTSQLGTVSPNHAVYADGDTFCPVAVSHSWRDDITTLTLMQR